MNDIIKYFNKENNILTNQKVIGTREMFRGVVIKSRAALLLAIIKLKKYNNILVKKSGRVL